MLSLMMTNPPEDDEIEISIFGPGFGECIVIHAGNNEWIIIDSCKSKKSSSPVALDYFKSLKITPNVKLVCTSHWHDDHILGISEILNEFQEATLVLSAALNDNKFTQIVLESPASRNIYKNKRPGVLEMKNIYSELFKKKRNKILAKINTDIYQNKESGFSLRSISPNNSTTMNSILNLIKNEINENPSSVVLPDVKPNDISVVLQASFGNTSILLGADLESEGWGISIQNEMNLKKSNLYKVAHHGGKSGDHDNIWSQALEKNPISVIAPFNRGCKLPNEEDVKRILNNSSEVYLTAMRGKKVKHQYSDKYVKKSLEEKKASYLQNEYGYICLRKKINSEDNWNVTAYGSAEKVDLNNIKEAV